MASTVEIPLENPCKRHFRDSKFQNVPRCLGPSRTCAFGGASSKVAYYSLSACYLEPFWQPCMLPHAVAWDGHLHCGTMYGLPICPWAQSVFSRLFFFFHRICRTTVCWDLEFFSTLAENSDERAGGVGFRLATSWLGERRRSEGRSRREGKRAIPLHVSSRNRKRALTKSSVGYNMGRSGSQSSG